MTNRGGVEGRGRAPKKVIVHIDMDCFYVQVERSIDRSLLGVPCAVVQYNPFGDLSTVTPTENRRVENNGSLIAVSYEARAAGVSRFMRGTEAKRVCPQLQLIQVPVAHGKADINIYRNAGERVVDVITSRYRCIVEKASVDEVFLDLTEEALQLLHNSTPESFFQEILTPVIDSKVIISLTSQPPGVNLSVEKERDGDIDGDSDGVSDGDVARDIHDICAKNKSLNSIPSSSISTKEERASIPILSPTEWLQRPLNLWFPDESNGGMADDQKELVEKDQLLICASLLVSQIRKDIFDQLGFTCSAGISHTKLIAKVASAMNKPDKQTIVPLTFIPTIMTSLPLSKIKGFGGKLGTQLKEQFGITLAGELSQLGEAVLSTKYELTQCKWMISAAKGELDEPLTPRTLPENITCGKTFRGVTGLHLNEFFTSTTSSPETTSTISDSPHGVVLKWVKELSEELIDRLNSLSNDHSRFAKQASVSFTIGLLTNPSFAPVRLTKSFSLPIKYTAESLSLIIHNHMKNCLTRVTTITPAVLSSSSSSCRITSLFLSANSFETRVVDKHAINHYFSPSKSSQSEIELEKNPEAPALQSESQSQSGSGSGSGSASFLPQDIDPEVFNSLPETMQEELREFYQNGNSTRKRFLSATQSTRGAEKKKKAEGISKYFHKIN